MKQDFGIHLIAKTPAPGWCNTRLASRIGEKEAADLQRSLLLDTLAIAQKSNLPIHLVLGLPPAEFKKLDFEVPIAEAEISRVDMPSLGSAIEHAAKYGIDLRWKGALFLGVDAPLAIYKYLGMAISKLKEHQVVLGPTRDGGVYIIGARETDAALWRDVPWGTEDVFDQLRQNTRAEKWNLDIMDADHDIDRYEDFVELKSILAEHPQYAPATAELIQSWPTN